MSTSATQGSHK